MLTSLIVSVVLLGQLPSAQAPAKFLPSPQGPVATPQFNGQSSYFHSEMQTQTFSQYAAPSCATGNCGTQVNVQTFAAPSGGCYGGRYNSGRFGALFGGGRFKEKHVIRGRFRGGASCAGGGCG